MKTPKLILLLSIIILAACTEQAPKTQHTIWFDKPAQFFEESLVLGNGKMGASVFGGIETDSIYLNDATLWAGEPVNPDMNPEAYKNLPAIREALENEDYPLADKLNRSLQGKFSESFAPLGTMYLNFNHSGEETNYHRELDISKAVSKLSYTIGDIDFQREYFISYPDQVMVIKLTSSKAEALDFSIGFDSQLNYNFEKDNNSLIVNGYAPYHAEPNYRGDMPDAIQFDPERGTRFSTLFSVKNNGKMELKDNKLNISLSDEVIIYVSIATSFNGFDKDPAKEGLDNNTIAKEQLASAINKSYSTLKDKHIKDYTSFFDRVELDLGETEVPDLSTDERLVRYAEGGEDKNLEVLYFQFGRYLMISSSRTPGVPANLQGIWNPYMRPPWSSNYTMNINVEENYWLAEVANLSEMHKPFLDFIGNLAVGGEVTARNFYGAQRGWAACHNSDIWAMSNPVGDFGKGHPCWANWNMSGTWSVTHLWDHYLFTGDLDFLENYAYPLMKGAAEFCLDWLLSDKDGNLITSPSTSPENIYITKDGYRGSTLYGSTSDLAMIKECFKQVIKASYLLDIDKDFRIETETALARLYPYQIGEKGNLQEWYHDWEDADPRHRHQSHLFGLYPGTHITPEHTPALANACRKSLEIKGDESTGWSKGWRINLWARLRDGNHAYKMYRTLLRFVDPSGLKTEYSRGGGTYPNLFDAHPPFQIDGNFGGAAGVAEMLLQSTETTIDLLPAIPDVWPEGEVLGLCARGGFEVDIKWKESAPSKVEIFSAKGGKTTLRFKDQTMDIELKANEKRLIKW